MNVNLGFILSTLQQLGGIRKQLSDLGIVGNTKQPSEHPNSIYRGNLRRNKSISYNQNRKKDIAHIDHTRHKSPYSSFFPSRSGREEDYSNHTPTGHRSPKRRRK